MEIGRDAQGIKSLNRHALEQVVALSSDGILIVDARSESLPIIYGNAAYEAMTGYSIGELVGRSWSVARWDAERQPDLGRLRDALARGESCRIVAREERKDGTSWSVDLAVEPLRNARGDLKYFLCLHKPAAAAASPTTAALPADELLGDAIAEAKSDSGIRDLGKTRPKLASLDKTDPVTGLLRFAYFEETLRRDLAMARRDQRFATLLLFSIVELDVYRQTFGSKAAEYCQRMIGTQILRTLRRASDLCARYDDSTLVAAVFGQAPDEARFLATRIAEAVRGLALHNPRAKLGRQITVETAVVGCPPGTKEDPEVLITRALASIRDSKHGLRPARAS
jgi:PAS domain S-box-containing protein/diguanylate cyclase (GGDEF)-like protein